METCIITFRSVTTAQRGELLLRREAIACTLTRTPKLLADQGCGYSLRLSPGSLPKALELLRQNAIGFRKAYCTDGEGQPREIRL